MAKSKKVWNGASAVAQSKNSKVVDWKKGQKVAATYVSFLTCPPTCPFWDGCYAKKGKVGMYMKKLEASAGSASIVELAQREAAAVDELKGIYPLRGHVAGDCTTDETAQIVSASYDRYTAKHGQPVWAYTHAWRTVDRASWGGTSVLASCETLADAKLAMDKGYAVAVVTAKHPSDGKAHRDAATGIKAIPCPAQTRKDVTCASCGLCLKADRLLADNAAIEFEAHGPGAKAVRSALGEVAEQVTVR